MRMTQLFGRPSKTEGTDYEIISHRLLVQAGFIRESTAGRYFMLPLGMAVHHKVSDVVRRQMNKTGAQEMVTPVLHPLELWAETNRTTTAGFELMKVRDRRGADFALGGTAEEMAVDVVRKFNLSYKDLPFHIYQFSMKFRDEMRARGGLLRVREFVMKDGYSFSTKEQFKAIRHNKSRLGPHTDREQHETNQKAHIINNIIIGDTISYTANPTNCRDKR
jgi:prolyl-tRNA synthetase